MEINVNIEDNKFKALIDTGAFSNYVPVSLIDELKMIRRKESSVVTVTDGKEVHIEEKTEFFMRIESIPTLISRWKQK